MKNVDWGNLYNAGVIYVSQLIKQTCMVNVIFVMASFVILKQ